MKFFSTILLAMALIGAAPDPAVDAETTELVRATLARYFSEAKLAVPEPMSVVTRADIDTVAEAPRLKGLTIEVAMTTDHPANVLLGARNFLSHEMEGRGYRFGATADEADLRVPATLKFQIAAPLANGGVTRFGLKPVLTFTALVLAAVALMVLAFSLSRRAFRRPSRPPAKGPVGDAAPHVFAGGEPSVHGSAQTTFKPLPDVMLNEGPADVAGEIRAQAERNLRPELEALVLEIAGMPLERAMHLLAAVSAEDRELLFDRLNLHQSVRRRVERELVASGRMPELGPLPT